MKFLPAAILSLPLVGGTVSVASAAAGHHRAAADHHPRQAADPRAAGATDHRAAERRLSSRHWATLIPPSRLAALTLDDAHLYHSPDSVSEDGTNTNHASSSPSSFSSSSLSPAELEKLLALLPPEAPTPSQLNPQNAPNYASPQSISQMMEQTNERAVDAAIAAGASISQIENLAFGGYDVDTLNTLAAYHSAHSTYSAEGGPNRASVDPTLESSPHIFDMESSNTQPWLTYGEMDRFVGGAEHLRPDLERWREIVLPDFMAGGDGGGDSGEGGEKEVVTLVDIVAGSAGAGGNGGNNGGNTNAAAGGNDAAAGGNTGSNGGATVTISGGENIYVDIGPSTSTPGSTTGTATTSTTATVVTTTAAPADTNAVPYDPTTDFSDLMDDPNVDFSDLSFPGADGTTASTATTTDTTTTSTTATTASTTATTTDTVSTATTFADIKNLPKPSSTNKLDPTIQGGVQLQNTDASLPYPLNLPWYPADGQPWVDPSDFPTFSTPTEDGMDAISANLSPELQGFIQNVYWDNVGASSSIGARSDFRWNPESYFSYGPPCTVTEVLAYNQELVAKGVLPSDVELKVDGTASGRDGKINGGRKSPPLKYMGDEKRNGNGSLGRCEGDCDDDADCGPGLVCHQRNDRGVIPGCTNWGKDAEKKIGSQSGTDYCVREIDEEAYDAGFYDDYDDEDMEMQVVDQELGLLLPPHCSGPQGWADVVAMYSPEAKYWEQFSEWIGPSLHKNQCGVSASYNHNPTNNDFAGIYGAVAGVVGREIDDEDNEIDEEALQATFETRVVEHQQSPIDVRRSMANALCFEYHQIRHKKGDFDIRNGSVKKQILPNKLRLEYPQEYNEKKWEDGVGGPSADMPKGWGHQLPVTHIDIKLPSEHWFEGKQYAAEYQIYLIQDRDSMRGAPAISVLVDLHPNDYPNIKFQEMLDQFQAIWDADMADCEGLVRRRRRIMEAHLTDGGEAGPSEEEVLDLLRNQDMDDWADVLTENDAQFENHRTNLHRKAQDDDDVWDPWHEDIIASNFFLGYEGSLTEPPCTEFISWRIMDRPALISKAQLLQMKKLLFNHVDGKCRPTSNHYEGSVARPLQPFNDREMWQCTCRDYLGDDERKWYGRNRCWAGDEEIFHERTEDGLYWASKPPQPERKGVFDCGGEIGLTPPCCGKTYDPWHSCCARGDC